MGLSVNGEAGYLSNHDTRIVEEHIVSICKILEAYSKFNMFNSLNLLEEVVNEDSRAKKVGAEILVDIYKVNNEFKGYFDADSGKTFINYFFDKLNLRVDLMKNRKRIDAKSYNLFSSVISSIFPLDTPKDGNFKLYS